MLQANYDIDSTSPLNVTENSWNFREGHFPPRLLKIALDAAAFIPALLPLEGMAEGCIQPYPENYEVLDRRTQFNLLRTRMVHILK